MKREAMGHTKMKRLCRRMDIPLWQGVGLLESLWHITGRECPQGDIGKLSDEDIALAIDYRGDEAKMVESLIAAGWLDRDAIYRLVVHDWFDHADDAVHMRLARTRKFFASGESPKYTRLPGKERESAHAFYTECQSVRTPCAQNAIPASSQQPEPVTSNQQPEPEPEPEGGPPRPLASPQRIETSAASAGIPRQAKRPIQFPENALAERGRKWLEGYPNQVDVDAAMREWLSLVNTEQRANEHFEALGRYMASAKWRNASGELDPGKIKSPLYFIRDGLYRDSPPPFKSRDGPEDRKFLSKSERNDEAARAQFQKLMAKKQEHENAGISRNR